MSTPEIGIQDAPADFSSEWDAWHHAHEILRADAHGFLAISSLTFLTTEPQRIVDAPGAWSTSERGPVVVLADGESIVVNGVTVTDVFEFGPLPERTGIDVVVGDVVVEVARRGGNDIVRPRNPQTPLRVFYPGTPTFTADSRWVVDAVFSAFDAPRPVTVGSVVEGLEHVYDSPGQVSFSLDGQEFALTVFNGHQPGTLSALFTDETSGVSTYAANRSVAIDAPDAEGNTRIDFNRAVNLPCAYTEFATCPLPPRENRLAIGIEAGEKSPLGTA